MTTAAYAPHARFIEPARIQPGLGRLLFGILAIEVVFALALTAFGTVVQTFSPGFAQSFYYGDTPLGLMVQLLSFAMLGASVALVLVKSHERSFLTAIGPLEPAYRNMIACFLAVALFYLALEIFPPWWDLGAATERRSLILWLMMTPFGLFALMIQTGAEEMFYRGYIQQQLAARFKAPWVWMVVPNLLFAAAHWDNGATDTESWQYIIWAFAFGCAASDLTARTGNLGAAIGFHLANNAYAFLLYGEFRGPDSGLALFLFPPEMPLPGNPASVGPILSLPLIIDLVIVALAWLAARIACRR